MSSQRNAVRGEPDQVGQPPRERASDRLHQPHVRRRCVFPSMIVTCVFVHLHWPCFWCLIGDPSTASALCLSPRLVALFTTNGLNFLPLRELGCSVGLVHSSRALRFVSYVV